MNQEEEAEQLGKFLQYCIKSKIEPIGKDFIECRHLSEGGLIPVLHPRELAKEFLKSIIESK